MKRKTEIVGIVLALICTVLLAIGVSSFIERENLIIFSIPGFCIFLMIILSIYIIIKKADKKFGIWLFALGINAMIMLLSAMFTWYIGLGITIVGVLVLTFIGGKAKF